jgi:sec-independent protein translocase protein TatB
MFDIGYSELLVIGVVALVVIGPERLPRVARTTGLLLGRLQRYVGDVKADIRREMRLEELKALRNEAQQAMRDFERDLIGEPQVAERNAGQTGNALEAGVPPSTPPLDAAPGEPAGKEE